MKSGVAVGERKGLVMRDLVHRREPAPDGVSRIVARPKTRPAVYPAMHPLLATPPPEAPVGTTGLVVRRPPRRPDRRRRALRLGVLPLLWLPFLGTLSAVAVDPTWHLAIQTYSLHEHTSETYLHNTTPGLGLLRRQEGWLLGAGVFPNSIGRWAGYGYGGYQWPVGPLLAGGIGGITHHYEANEGGPVPLAAAVVTIPLGERWAIDLIGIPRVAHYTYSTLNVSVSWRFK